MKKLLFLLLPLAAMTLNSCSKNEDNGTTPADNQVFINGQTYDFIEDLSSVDSSTPGEVSLSLEAEGTIQGTKDYINIDFDEVYVPDGGTRLVAGTYSHSNSGAAFTFGDGEVWANNVDWEEEIKGGTMVVVVSGNTYTIQMTCTLSGGGSLKGTYKGSL